MACTLAERYVIGVFQGFPLVGFNQIANLKIFTAWTTFFSSALLYSVESPSNGTVVDGRRFTGDLAIVHPTIAVHTQWPIINAGSIVSHLDLGMQSTLL